VRHGTAEARALVVPEAADRARIVFERPARAVAPGQAAVVYLGDEVLGGGPISTSCRGAA
jgi:tRNA-specific 2-thiouridylase